MVDWFPPSLPALDASVRRSRDLEEKRPAARLQHPPYAFECLLHTGNGAEGEGGDDPIDTGVSEGNPLAWQIQELDSHARVPAPRLRQTNHRWVRLESEELGHPRAIVV